MSTSHRIGNLVLTGATNVLHGASFTDVMTGHKVFRRHSFQRLGVNESRFAFEVECTSMALERGLNIGEIPVDYHVRRFGTAKIRWYDGILCLAWILGYKVMGTLRQTSRLIRNGNIHD